MSVSRLSVDQLRIVDFAVRWHRYGGGGAEDIFVDFGLSESDYFIRLETLLSARSLATGLDSKTIADMRDVCRQRIDAADTSIR
ncbi:hypothetical protein [Williamsia muralis]|uniref:hypothetical protein n=1 Tax=Williamsia marianensis TaxID=85044 RepID=UPI000C12448A|nr:hypothetical protein [Williamsia marianensis]